MVFADSTGDKIGYYIRIEVNKLCFLICSVIFTLRKNIGTYK